MRRDPTKLRAYLFGLALLASMLMHFMVGGPLYRAAIEVAAPPKKVERRIVLMPVPPPAEDANLADPGERRASEVAQRASLSRRPARRSTPRREAPRPAEPANQEQLPPAPTRPPRVADDHDSPSGGRPSSSPVDLRRKGKAGEMGRIVVGRGLPFQPSLGLLESSLTKEDRVAKILQSAMRRPIGGTASPEAYEELGPLVRRLDAAWDTLANDRLRGSQLSGVTAFLRKMSEGSTAWKQYYGDFYSRRTDGDLLDQVGRGPGREDQLRVGEHLELVVELHHDDRGDVTSVVVVESSGDVTFDEDVRRSFLDITSSHRPRGNNIKTSRIRLIADSRVAVPRCGAYVGTAHEQLWHGTEARAAQVVGCGVDFGEKGIEVPFSTQVSGATQLESAEMR